MGHMHDLAVAGMTGLTQEALIDLYIACSKLMQCLVS